MFKGKTKRGVDVKNTLGIRKVDKDTVWVVVAHRAGVQFFDGTDKSPRLIKSLSFPQGRLKGRELITDKPGRSFDSYGEGRHATESKTSPTEHVEDSVASQIAQDLRAARIDKRYSRLILVAGPKLIGKLKHGLDSATSNRIVKIVQRDFAKLTAPELSQKVKSILA